MRKSTPVKAVPFGLLTPRRLLTTIFLYFLGQIFFLINIQYPVKPNFDEFHYIPSAKQFLSLSPNQNWEHPPLGKMLMAVGIALWGDQPLGWRFMSTVFGALTLAGMYVLGLVLFGTEEAALWITFLTLFNQLLYVQARIGMLDTFMLAFIVWGMAAFCLTWRTNFPAPSSRILLRFAGVMFGLATATKWFGLIPWLGCVGLVLGIYVFQHWEVLFDHPKKMDWYFPTLWKEVEWKEWFISFGVIPITVYFITFLPFFFIPGAASSPLDLIRMQFNMYSGQLRVVNSHPYMSQWWDWPLLTRPIWYAFDTEGPEKEWVRGVLLIGNPLLMVTGLAAIGVCFWEWIWERKLVPFLIFYFYFIFYACWILIPRKIAFYYYYYPAGTVLSLALAYVFFNPKFTYLSKDKRVRWSFLAVAFGFFLYFFPILAALRIPMQSYRQWMWFQSWI